METSLIHTPRWMVLSVLEETYLETNDPASSPVGFFEGNTSVFYWEIDGSQWFNRTKVNGVKTQYRSRYTIGTYYKWTNWGVDAPAYNDAREYETDTVYRYANKNYHIVYVGIEGYLAYTEVLVGENELLDVSQFLETEGHSLEGFYTDVDCTKNLMLLHQ